MHRFSLAFCTKQLQMFIFPINAIVNGADKGLYIIVANLFIILIYLTLARQILHAFQ